jgi:hypothetical protein
VRLKIPELDLSKAIAMRNWIRIGRVLAGNVTVNKVVSSLKGIEMNKAMTMKRRIGFQKRNAVMH